jgi:dephospho-CoA kinase
MSLQWKDDQKKEYADYIIENSGTLDQLKSSITFILKEIRENEKHN